MDKLVSSKINVAIDELINIQKQYVDYRETIKNILKDYLIELTNEELQIKINSELWKPSKTIDENIYTLIDAYYGYVCSLMIKNEDVTKIAKFLFIMYFNE